MRIWIICFHIQHALRNYCFDFISKASVFDTLEVRPDLRRGTTVFVFSWSWSSKSCVLFHWNSTMHLVSSLTLFIIEETTVLFVLCNLITCLFRLWARLWPILHLLSTAFCYVCYLVHFTFSKQICYRVKMAELSENSLSESVKGCVWFTCKCIYYSFFNRYDDTLSFKYGKCITFRILKWRERMKQLSSLQLSSFKKLGQSLV